MRFHHSGLACTDLDRETAGLQLVGYSQVGADFEDAVQGVRGRFLEGGGPRIELLQELVGSDILKPWLRAGSRLYHQAYETARFDHELGRLVSAGSRAVSAARPAPAFDGRRICFVMLPNLCLVELIECDDR